MVGVLWCPSSRVTNPFIYSSFTGLQLFSSREKLKHLWVHPFSQEKQASISKVEDLVYIHSNLRLISRAKTDYSEGPWKLWDVNLKDANLDTPEFLMTNISLADSIDLFVVGDLHEA